MNIRKKNEYCLWHDYHMQDDRFVSAILIITKFIHQTSLKDSVIIFIFTTPTFCHTEDHLKTKDRLWEEEDDLFVIRLFHVFIACRKIPRILYTTLDKSHPIYCTNLRGPQEWACSETKANKLIIVTWKERLSSQEKSVFLWCNAPLCRWFCSMRSVVADFVAVPFYCRFGKCRSWKFGFFLYECGSWWLRCGF